MLFSLTATGMIENHIYLTDIAGTLVNGLQNIGLDVFTVFSCLLLQKG